MAGSKGYSRTITINFDYTQVTGGVKDVNKQMALLDSEYRKASEGAKLYGGASEQTVIKQEALTQKVGLQSIKVDELRKKYEEYSEKLGESNNTTINAKTSYNNAEAALEKLKKQLEAANREVEKQEGFVGNVITKFNDFKTKANEVGIDVDKLADSFLKAGTMLTGVGILSAKMAMDFDTEMGKVSAATGRTGDDLDKLKDIVLNTSDKYGIAAGEMAAAAQRVAWDWENAGEKLDNAARLSTVSTSSMVDSVKLLESVATAYGSTIDEQTQLVDKLVVAYQRGEFSMGELGQSFGRVASIAAESGVSIDELLAIISSATNVGASASEAVTGLRQVISSIVKPSAEAKKMADELGIEFDAQALKSKGLAGVLDTVRVATRGNTDDMAKLFGNVNALAQIMSIAGSDNAYYKDSLLLIKDAAGQTDTVLEAMNTPAKHLNDAINRLKNAFIDTGGSLQWIVEVAAKLLNRLASISPAAVKTGTAIGLLLVVLGGGFKVLTTMSTMLQTLATLKMFFTKQVIANTTAQTFNTAANTANSTSQVVGAATGKVLTTTNTMLGISFQRLLIPMLIILAIIAAIVTAYILLSKKSKNAANDVSNSNDEIRKSMEDTQNYWKYQSSSNRGGITGAPQWSGYSNARGTSYSRGERSLVGEEGPELVDLPQGSQVRTAAVTRGMMYNRSLAGNKNASGSEMVQNNYLQVKFEDIDQVYKLTQLFEDFAHNVIVVEGV